MVIDAAPTPWREREPQSAVDDPGTGCCSHAAAVADLEQRCAGLENALQSNRRISVAIGIAMATLKLTDSQAFERLAALSQHQNRKLRELAEDVILTGSVPPTPHAAGAVPTDG